MMKFSWAISRVKWWSGLLTAQTFDPADSLRELHHIQLPGKQQISKYYELNNPGRSLSGSSNHGKSDKNTLRERNLKNEVITEDGD
jgi:hypothetical protein